GPVGIGDFVKTSLRVSQSRLSYPLYFIELTKENDVIFKDKQFTVRCNILDLGITSFGYRIEEAPHEGELQVEKLQALGIPSGPLYG
ncbi:ribonuclease Z, partial [Enterococcus faecalis]